MQNLLEQDKSSDIKQQSTFCDCKWSNNTLMRLGYKTNGTSYNFDKACSGAPDGSFEKVYLIRDANHFDKSPNSTYLK